VRSADTVVARGPADRQRESTGQAVVAVDGRIPQRKERLRDNFWVSQKYNDPRLLRRTGSAMINHIATCDYKN
jgi:hypothetical protein